MISTWQLGRECNQSTPQKVKCGSCGEKEVVKGILDETLAKLNSICLPHSRSESSNDQGILGQLRRRASFSWINNRMEEDKGEEKRRQVSKTEKWRKGRGEKKTHKGLRKERVGRKARLYVPFYFCLKNCSFHVDNKDGFC